MQECILIGILKPGGYLNTVWGDVLLTRISMEAAQSPESAIMEIFYENVGKIAIVRGNFVKDVVYSAQIIEIVSSSTSSLIKALIDKNRISLKELQDELFKCDLIKKKLCALVIGHKKSSPGAINKNSGISEFEFNEELAIKIEKKVEKVDVQRVYRRTYEALPQDINALNPDFVISLHCNAFDGEASGTEVLYYHKSEMGKKMAEILLKHLVEHLRLPNRGIKPKTAEDRGGYLLCYTKAPCIISEPFFIDNDNDLAKAKEDLDGLALAYAKAIEEISEII